ncbi:hypothetical protein SLEP1_g50348 [Rubroshorea leprosula]|uniref:Uncharacterized protein n=1 Tax=Rubroshorea leprosula TaxID=152421 RepID=A0AAV5M284_9ROSI|nr:hypothetical protein SLEP1_g50348 [Rubroshorea leprosula]
MAISYQKREKITPHKAGVAGGEKEEQSRSGISSRGDHLSETDDERTPTGSTEPAQTTKLEERTRVLEMAMGKILAHLIPDDPLIPLLNRDAQPATVVATKNSPALSNIVVPTRLRGSGKLNNEPSSSKHNEELMRKNADLERQLRDVQKSIDELKSPRSHQQTLDLDSAPLNLSITTEPYQEGFKIPHLETYDGSGDPNEHLHTYQAIMRIQNANDAMMCEVFPATLKSTARRWYHKLPRHSIDSYSQLAKLFSNKFASQREIKRTATELMQLGRFLDDLLENPPKSWNEVNDRSASFILSEDFQSSKRQADDKQGKELKQPENRDDKKKQKIQHWVKRPPPQTHDSSRDDRSKYCDYHRVYGHNTEDCQSLKDELEFLARNGKLEGYVQKPFVRQPTQTHFVQEYGRSQAPGYQLGNNPNSYQAGPYSSEPNRAYRGRPFSRRGQGQKAPTQNQNDHRGVGYGGIPPPSGTINMIFGGMHSGGQSARARKAYARQVMTVNKNRPLKRPFEEAEWENAAITFSPVDYKRADGEPNVMMPHADPFVAAVHIGNHNVNNVFIDTGSSPDIIYWSCFQKMQLNPSSLQKYEGPIYGFDNQLVPVEGVITLPIYVGSEPRFRMASVSFLVVKMESAFNAILGRATLCELKAVISQPHLCMKFPTPQGVGVLKGNQRMARACYQDTFKKVELAVAPRSSESSRLTQPGQRTMSISDIKHRPEGVEQKAEPIEPIETVPLNPDVPERTVKIGTKLTEEERTELLEFLRVNQDVFAWTTDEMPGIPTELTVHKLSTDPTRRPVAGFIRRVEYFEWVSNPMLVKKPNGKWRMCIDFTNLNEACPKDPHPLPNVEKLVERATGHERMSFLDASSGYHQVQLLLDDQEKTAFYVGDTIYCYVMMPFGLKNAGATYQKLVQIIFKLQIGKNIEVYVDYMIITSARAEDHIDDLSETFQNLRRAQMKLNPLKCTFVVESGKFLGFIARSAERCLPFFKALREPKHFQWTDECQRAFDELKQYLASAPLLSKLVEGENLYLYMGVTGEAVSSALLREENKNQKPICYMSKVLQGAEQNYPLVEKAAFALVYTARKLRAYFQSHQIIVYTDLPLRKILQKPDLSGRLIRWSVELSEYDLKFRPHTTIKGQAVADFLVECISATMEEKAPEHPAWVLYVDGAANIEGSGAGAVLVGPDGFKSEHALRFKFQTTNNAAEYEDLIYGLKLAFELKVQSIQVFSDSQLVVGQVNGSYEIRDPQLGRYASVVNRLKSIFVIFQIDKIPRADNHRADQLSKLASSQDINPQRSTIVKVLDAPSYTDFTVECQLLSTDPSTQSWTTPLINYLQSGEIPEDPSASKLIRRRAAHFTLIDNQLYKRAASMPLLRCLTPYEAEYAVREVHEGVCGTHIGGKTLARKLLRHGYYWPTMVEDAQNYVKKCSTCQFNADDIHMPGDTLSPLSSPWPFAQWGVDLLGLFVKGKGGCTYLVVAVDYFTKWIEAKPLSTTTEKKIEEFLFSSILCRFGIPKRIIADNGPQFRAAALRSFCNNYGIELSLISATGETPFSLAYGVEAVIPVEVGLPSARSDHHDDQNNGQLLRENLDLVEEVREMARIRNMAHQSRVAKFYNKRVQARGPHGQPLIIELPFQPHPGICWRGETLPFTIDLLALVEGQLADREVSPDLQQLPTNLIENVRGGVGRGDCNGVLEHFCPHQPLSPLCMGKANVALVKPLGALQGRLSPGDMLLECHFPSPPEPVGAFPSARLPCKPARQLSFQLTPLGYAILGPAIDDVAGTTSATSQTGAWGTLAGRAEAAEALGTQLNFSTAFHPQTDGKSERTIQILEDMLRACVIDWKGSWDQHLSMAEFAYNNSYQSSIRMAPFEALYGRRCRSPVCWTELIKERLRVAQSRQKSYVDRRRQDLEFEVGDHVFLKVSPTRGVLRFGIRGKLSPRYIGPYPILERIGEVAYKLELPGNLAGVHDVFHVSLLRKKATGSTLLLPSLLPAVAEYKLRFFLWPRGSPPIFPVGSPPYRQLQPCLLSISGP